MPAAFRALDTNVAGIYMDGADTVELCRMDIRSGAVRSTVLPSAWCAEIASNLRKLLPLTELDERTTPEFLSLLMVATDSSGAPTALLFPTSPDANTLIVTLSTVRKNDVALVYIPRTDEAGFLKPGGPGSGGGGDSGALLALVRELSESKADKTAVIAYGAGDGLNLDDKNKFALKATVPQLAAAIDGETYKAALAPQTPVLSPSGKFDLVRLVTKVDFDAAIAGVSGYGAKSEGGLLLEPAEAPATGQLFSVDPDVVPLLAAPIDPKTEYSATVVKALTLNSVGKYELTGVATADDVAAKLNTKDVIEYGVMADGGVKAVTTAATAAARTKVDYYLDPDVPRMVNDVNKSQFDPNATKVPAINKDGLFDYASVALMTDLAAVQAGVNYKDAVVKTFFAVPPDISDLAPGARFLVNVPGDTTDFVNGIWGVPEEQDWDYAQRSTDFQNGVHVRGAYIFDTTSGDSYLCNNPQDGDIPDNDRITFIKYGAKTSYTFSKGVTVTPGTTEVTAEFAADTAALKPDDRDSKTAAGVLIGTQGVATTVARSDHRHPSDTLKADLDSPSFTGSPRIAYTTAPDKTKLTGVGATDATIIATCGWVAGLGFATASTTITALTGRAVPLAAGTAPAAGTNVIDVLTPSGGATTAREVVVQIGTTAGTLASGGDSRFNPLPDSTKVGRMAYDDGTAWAAVNPLTGSSQYGVFRMQTSAIGVAAAPTWGPLNLALDTSPADTAQLPATKGGTGLRAFTKGDILYADSDATLAKLNGPTVDNQVLGYNKTDKKPVWGAVPGAISAVIAGDYVSVDSTTTVGSPKVSVAVDGGAIHGGFLYASIVTTASPTGSVTTKSIKSTGALTANGLVVAGSSAGSLTVVTPLSGPSKKGVVKSSTDATGTVSYNIAAIDLTTDIDATKKLPAAQVEAVPYDIAAMVAGVPGISASATTLTYVFRLLAARPCRILRSATATHYAGCGTKPGAAVTFKLKYWANAANVLTGTSPTEFGTIVFDATGAGTVTIASDRDMAAGGVITLESPTSTVSGIADIYFTLAAIVI